MPSPRLGAFLNGVLRSPRLRGFHHTTDSQASHIFILESGNIYRNLAFEACLYTDSNRFVSVANGAPAPTDMLLWRSDPCVVIGRFQNAWNEVRTDVLRQRGWSLARRESGGGAVFHDSGNLNICFMQSRRILDRRKCMEVLQSALQTLLKDRVVHVGDRYDLWVTRNECSSSDEKQSARRKISGSSSRLGSKVSYHHCTLLCESDLNNLSGVLLPSFKTLRTKASTSVRSPVVNLNLPVEQVQQCIIDHAIEWIKQINKSSTIPQVLHVPEGSEAIYVKHDQFEQKLIDFQRWSWIYGASPAFELELGEAAAGTTTSPVSAIRLLCERGGRVTALQPTGNGELKPELRRFISDLSETLTGLECRPFAWHIALDQLRAKYAFGQSQTDFDTEQESIVKALKTLSSRF